MGRLEFDGRVCIFIFGAEKGRGQRRRRHGSRIGCERRNGRGSDGGRDGREGWRRQGHGLWGDLGTRRWSVVYKAQELVSDVVRGGFWLGMTVVWVLFCRLVLEGYIGVGDTGRMELGGEGEVVDV